jgi:SAM-dependent methyltransferase
MASFRMSSLPLRVARKLLRRVNQSLNASYRLSLMDEPFDAARLRQAEEALRQLHADDPGAKAYLEKHIPRLARTLALVPPPSTTSRVLELGCYMQITPFLERMCGYREVSGGYFGTLGHVDTKRVQFPDRDFVCQVAHFDAERDRYPYPDAYFDLVIAGEIVEHFVYDPIYALLEARRVLIDGGYLLVSTPNVASISSVGKLLDGHNNPQIYAAYTRPADGVAPEVGHVREYTFHELEVLVRSAGFEPQLSFTTFLPEYALHLPYLSILEENGFDPKNRGEQSWCLAVKRAALPVDRYPFFLYTS